MSNPQQAQQIDPIRMNAVMTEITQQRDYAFARASGLAADLASLTERIKLLEAQNKSYEQRLAQAAASEATPEAPAGTPIPFSLISGNDAA